MSDRDIRLLEQATAGLEDVETSIRALIQRGSLPRTWHEIADLLATCRSELCFLEGELLAYRTVLLNGTIRVGPR